MEGFHGSGKPDGAFKSILLGVDDDEEVKEVYAPSMELQSISCLLQENINTIRSPLESVVTTDTFLDVEGKGKENFEEQYMLFLAGVQRMEIYVCNYLKVTLLFAYQTDLLIVYHSFFSCIGHSDGKITYTVFRISKLNGCLAPERTINFAVNLQWKMTIPAEC